MGLGLSRWLFIVAIVISLPGWAKDSAVDESLEACEEDLLSVPKVSIPSLDGKHTLGIGHANVKIFDSKGVEKFETSFASEDRVLAGYYNPLTGRAFIFTVKGGVYSSGPTPEVKRAILREQGGGHTQFTAAAVGGDEYSAVMVSWEQQLYFYDVRANKLERRPIDSDLPFDDEITSIEILDDVNMIRLKDAKFVYLLDRESLRVLQTRPNP